MPNESPTIAPKFAESEAFGAPEAQPTRGASGVTRAVNVAASDRRDVERAIVRTRVTVRGPRAVHDAFAIDASRNGCQLLMTGRVAAGSEYELEFHTRDGGTLRRTATAVWCVLRSEGFAAGFRIH